ncbi:MAG: DoxX family protein [Deltaproteobacteria bacterium]|nr:MAG: DoxX family protein [Deltaproteobacteria bacterium]
MLKNIFKILLSLLLISAGCLHFLNTEFFLKIVPPYIPAPLWMVWISGVSEIILGIALQIPKISKISSWAIILLFIAVFPANLHMYLRPERFPDIPRLGLLLRLPIQGVLIAWAYWVGKVNVE